MSSTAASARAAAQPRAGEAVQRSYAAQVVREALHNWGARLGLVWIAVLVVAAVFAPFLANSYPLLVSMDGELASPLLRSLSWADTTLLVVFATVTVLCFVHLSFRAKLAIAAGILAVSVVASLALVSPPQLNVYSQYRDRQAAGAYDWVIRAPVPYSPKDYLRDFGATGLQAPLEDPQHTHWLGTEESGSDVLSRMLHAARIALSIGFVATGIALVIGVILGGLMGYFSSTVDIVGMRLVEIFEAIPTLILLLTFIQFYGRSLYAMMVIIGVTTWTGYARYIRAEFLRLREQEFVQAAIACGLPLRSVLFRHMLPNGIAPILVIASFGVASAILFVATLSFLGLGLVDNPSWGALLNQAVQASTFNWWLAAFPGGAIFLTVFAYTLIGEALRDALDPYLKKTSS